MLVALITVRVPEDAKFSEYLLKISTSGGEAVAKMAIKPQTGILLTVFAVPLFLSAGMIAGGSYIFVKKKGIFRFAGIGVAIIGALILFGVVMILVVFKMV